MQHPLAVQAGVDPSEGMWAGECVGCFQGNKLYSGAVINDQYFAVGSDVFLKAQPGELQVPPRGRHVLRRLPAASARALACGGGVMPPSGGVTWRVATRQYVARIMRMFERKDGAKMVTCKWFYRANETILAQDKRKLSQVRPTRPARLSLLKSPPSLF